MINYSKLITSHMISFKEALVLHYKEIGLNETQTMIIILLYETRKHQAKAISEKDIASKMTLSEQEIAKAIFELIESNYISLEMVNGVEQYSLIPTIDKLGEVLGKEEGEVQGELNIQAEAEKIVDYVEKNFGRVLSNSELLLIKRWFEEGFSVAEIKNAINESLRLKKFHLRYADALLVNQTVKREEAEVDPEIEEVLKKINVTR